MNELRRVLLQAAVAAIASLTFATALLTAAAEGPRMRIGIIGSGRIGVPLAGDDKEALDVAAHLVRDAGLEPVVVGPLASAKLFDRGTPVYGQALTARELKQRLGLD